MTKRTKRWVIACSLAVVIGGGLIARAATTRAQAVEVAAGSVQDRVIGRAVVTPVDGIAEVRARVEGRALRVLVREGDQVTEGQLLAEFESDEMRAEVERREAERRALSEQAHTVAEGARAEERTALEADVAAAKQEFEMAESRDKRERTLRASGAGTEVAAEEATHGLELARARLAGAAARSSLARAGGRRADVSAVEARIAAADAAIAQAKTGLDRTHLVSPIAGVILARRVNVGDTVSAATLSTGPPLFEIADVTRIEVRAELEEGDATKVREGQRVSLTSPGGGEELGRGLVTRLSPRLSRRTIGVEDARVRADGQVRAVWIDVSTWPGRPAVGQRLEAVLELAPREVRAMAPRGAVTVRDGRAIVEVPCGPLTCDVAVRLGVADEKNVELFGVDPGTRVVVRR